MKVRNILLTSAAVLFCTASMSGTSLLSHTWVSGSGSDSNPCTFASPCATFNGALAKTTAGGIITAKDAGDFGTVTIAQSVTIDGANMGSIGFGGQSEGIYIDSPSTTTAINVVIHNLTIDGQGTGTRGISVQNAANVTINNCRFEGFTVVGIEIYSYAAENVVVRNTTIVGGVYGVLTDSGSGPDMVSLDHVTIQGAEDVAVVTNIGLLEISNSVLTQNATAVYAFSSSTISVESSMLTLNTEAVCSMTGAKIRLENNDIFDNGTGVANCGGTVKTNGNNRDSGNTSGNPIPAADVSATVLF